MSADRSLAVVPVRDGHPSPGGVEAVAVAGEAWLVGSDAGTALGEMEGATTAPVRVSEIDGFDPAALAGALAPALVERSRVILPGSADGRDLAPRLAYLLDRPLVSAAIELSPTTATVVSHGGRIEHDLALRGPVVVTLQPGSFAFEPGPATTPTTSAVELPLDRSSEFTIEAALGPDPATMDLSDAGRIVAGGGGLDGAHDMALLGRVGAAIGASLGATRVVTDAGWTDPARQIGTTGVEVAPELYVALGISGAVQHVMGLGQPDHVIAVNLDASCPMMAMADLAVVCDASALLPALAEQLGVPEPEAAA